MILEKITNKELREFVEDVVDTFSTESKIEDAEIVFKNVNNLLVKKKLLNPAGAYQAFVEVLYCACLLHNIFYDETNVSTLFDLREIVRREYEDKYITMNGDIEAILQTIEAQDGEDSLVPLCKPSVNSPTELFAMAVWLKRNYVQK